MNHLSVWPPVAEDCAEGRAAGTAMWPAFAGADAALAVIIVVVVVAVAIAVVIVWPPRVPLRMPL